MNRRGRVGWLVAAGAVVVAAAVGGYLWDQHRRQAYTGLAAHFPESVAMFVEVRELGQWMPPQEGGAQPSAQGGGQRGTDPMLQVLSQVWAATPPVRASSLPDLLRARPMAIGLWLDGERVRGAAIVPLLPGQKAQLVPILKQKLGDGQPVATVDGVELRKVSEPVTDSGMTVLWGVSDQWAVMVSSEREAEQVLAPSAGAKNLAQDARFRSVVQRFPKDRGGYLYFRGDEIAKLAALKHGAEGAAKAPSAPEKPAAPATPAPPAAPPPGPERGASIQDGGAALAVIHALKGVAREDLVKVLSPESIQSAGLWTSPPLGLEKGWQAALWVGFNQPPKGIWRIVAEGSPQRPQIVDRLPKNGQVYVWCGGREPARVYQEAMNELGKTLPPDQMGWVRAAIGAAEGKLNFSFSNDLLPALGSEWCVVSDSKGEKGTARMGLFLSLKDSRRFEDLVANNLAKQLPLQATTRQGARIWSWKGAGLKGGGVDLVIAGGLAVLTNDPDWALATGGDAGKAWKALSEMKAPASSMVILDPSLWSKSNDVLVQATCKTQTDGIWVWARFPGDRPSWGGQASEGKGDQAKDGGDKGALSGASDGGPCVRGASGAI